MERNARNNTNYEFYTNIQMRRKKKEKRELVLDAIYDSSLVSKLTNYLMFSGKKSTAQKVIWKALEEIKTDNPVAVLELAMKNVTPMVEIRPRRIGGATYQVPREVQPDRGFSLASRWLIGAARAKNRKPT